MTVTLNIPYGAQKILDALNDTGYSAYVVGGCVRDAMLRREPHDWDLTTNATVLEMKEVFSNYTVYNTGIKHGTITVNVQGENYEVTTFRIDGEYSDGRHPDTVKFTDKIELDLARRDFTINAMAYNPKEGLVDPYNGQEDLKRKTVRAVGRASARFNEDGLRILRALRFAASLGFTIEPATASAIHSCKNMLERVAYERLQCELSKMLVAEDTDVLVRLLLDYSDVVCVLMPELRECLNYRQPTEHHQYDVYRHCVETVRNAPSELVMRLAALLHDVGKPRTASYENGVWHCYKHDAVGAEMVSNALRRLRYDNSTVKDVTWLVATHERSVAPSGKSVKKLLNASPSTELFWSLFALKKADLLAHAQTSKVKDSLGRLEDAALTAKNVLAGGECFSLPDLAVDGNTLMKLGTEPGPLVGQTLSYLLDEVVDGNLENDEDVLKEAATEYLRNVR